MYSLAISIPLFYDTNDVARPLVGMGWQLGTSCISDSPRWRMQCAYEGWNAREKSAYYRFRLYAFAMNLEEARLVLGLKLYAITHQR